MSITERGKSGRKTTQSKLEIVSANASHDVERMAVGPSQLTLEMLVVELEKSRKSLTEEFSATLNTVLGPINSSLGSIASAVAAHTVSISEMETTLSSQSDDIVALQQDVAALKTKLTTMAEEKDKLEMSVEDLVSRSKRQNLRIVGLPEDIEKGNPRQFMAELFKDVAGEALGGSEPELDRAHRTLGPKPTQGSRTVVVRFHRYIEKERVLRWAKEHRDVSFRGHRINQDLRGLQLYPGKEKGSFQQCQIAVLWKGAAIWNALPRPAQSLLQRRGPHI